ncbi:hypothetical protein SALBM135S_04341 [Streptomyces alboniger]
MSVMPSSGLEGVSTQIALVRSVSAARTASGSEVSATDQSTPQRETTLSKSRNVPPYASLGMTTWSPGASSVRSRQSSAASPDAKASPRRPPSSAARFSSRAVRVGFALRLYS